MSGRRALGAAPAAVVLVGASCGGDNGARTERRATPGAKANEAPATEGAVTKDFSYTGQTQNFAVPDGVNSLQITVRGAGGGGVAGYNGGTGGTALGTGDGAGGSGAASGSGGAGGAAATGTGTGGGGSGSNFTADSFRGPVFAAAPAGPGADGQIEITYSTSG